VELVINTNGFESANRTRKFRREGAVVPSVANGTFVRGSSFETSASDITINGLLETRFYSQALTPVEAGLMLNVGLIYRIS